MSDATRRAYGWCEHLRAGGTTGWTSYAGPTAGPPLHGWLPGAQQLELLRRLNLTGRPTAALADAVLVADLPLRGPLDLELVGVGARGVDPAALPDEELLRVAVGLLARRSVVGLRRAPSTPPAPVRVATRLWRRRWATPYRLAGDPVLVGALRPVLAAQGRAPRPDARRVVVVGAPLERMLLDAWWHRVLTRGALGWEQWLRGVVRRDRLPATVNLLAIAERARARGEDVRVALDPGAVERATGARGLAAVAVPDAAAAVPDPAVAVPDPAVAELTRRIGRVLAVHLEPAERERTLRRRVAPALARVAREAGLPAVPGPGSRLPGAAAEWVAERAVRLHHDLRGAGYPVGGEPEPVPSSGSHPAPGSPDHDGGALLRLATSALHATDRNPGGGL